MIIELLGGPVNLNIFKLILYIVFFKWIILLLSIMSLTVALSEREQNLLTHANLAKLVL